MVSSGSVRREAGRGVGGDLDRDLARRDLPRARLCVIPRAV